LSPLSSRPDPDSRGFFNSESPVGAVELQSHRGTGPEGAERVALDEVVKVTALSGLQAGALERAESRDSVAVGSREMEAGAQHRQPPRRVGRDLELAVAGRLA
jgi:hypothetical protein